MISRAGKYHQVPLKDDRDLGGRTLKTVYGKTGCCGRSEGAKTKRLILSEAITDGRHETVRSCFIAQNRWEC